MVRKLYEGDRKLKKKRKTAKYETCIRPANRRQRWKDENERANIAA